MKLNNTTQIIARELAQHYDHKRGQRHYGYEALRDRGLLAHPERIARIVVGQTNSGNRIAATALRIGDAIASTQNCQWIFREKFDVGLFLLSIAIHTGLYEARRANGEAPTSDRSREPYFIYAVGSPEKQTAGYLSTEGAFPQWTNGIDEDGRQLLYSHYYTPEVHPDSTWVRAVHHLEGIPFQINQAVLEVAQRVGISASNPTKRLQQEQILETANGLLGSEFHHRAHLDKRGRLYISRSPINFQQGDLSRGLIEFAEGIPLTEQGIDAIHLHIANCNGIKGDINERIQYSKDHHGTWLSYADGSSDGWLNASDPWQLLRACIELVSTKVGDRSNLIVPVTFPLHAYRG